MALVNREQLDLRPEAMTAVIPGDTLRFVIPVPALAGQPFVQPELMPDGSTNPDAGKPLVDYKGRPIGGTGFAFFNHKDNCWQAMRTDGEGILIFNGVNEEKAAQLEEMVARFVSSPREFTIEKLREFLDLAAARGFGDRYDSTKTWAASNLVASSESSSAGDPGIAHWGIHTRTKDVCHAVFLPGEGVAYQDGTASPQVAEGNGLVIVLRKEGTSAAVQPEVFAQSYRLATSESISDPSRQLRIQHPLMQ
jgi:hypothetical protein